MEVRELKGGEARACLPALAEVLLDCVQGGASVSFMHGLTRREAERFFEECVEKAQQGRRVLLGAFTGDELTGTVQAVWSPAPNQPHRADIAKLLVRRSARGQGVARALMSAVESACLRAGKWLLVLDTVAGDPAERLYLATGWRKAGVIPNYALYPDGRYCDTTVLYKDLRDGGTRDEAS